VTAAPAFPDLAPDIASGARDLGVSLPDGAAARLSAYLALLGRWNRAYNLTAVRDPADMVTRHVLDSLAVLPHLGAGTLLDVGSGAGLPGLVLALARPELEVTLLDSSLKKTRFLRQALAELAVANARVAQARMQEYRPPRSFDMVISRALGRLADLYRDARHLVAPGGRLLFMKGTRPDDELAVLDDAWGAPRVVRLEVPRLAAERHLIWLERPST